MRPGPAAAAAVIAEVVSVVSPPVPARELLAQIALQQGWSADYNDALEVAERWERAFLSLLRRDSSELARLGRFVAFDFNSSSPDFLQGCAFEEPSDDEATKESKRRRALFGDYVAVIATLSPSEFEFLCKGVLHEWGVTDAVVTPRSGDEGIDFYGHLKLEPLLSAGTFPGIERQLAVWMVGQAKHYRVGKVSTPDIRDLVGAIDLARANSFGGSGSGLDDLALRVCDPVFYLFFTTGPMSANSWRLLDASGVIGMDGEMVAAFLADRGIGTTAGAFDEAELRSWVSSLG